MLAPKCPTFNGRPTFANPMYLKKAQYEKPCLYAIPHDQSDPANRLVPDREETLTLEEESRSKLNKDLAKEIMKEKGGENHLRKQQPNIFKNIDFLPSCKNIQNDRLAIFVILTAQNMENLVEDRFKVLLQSLEDEIDELNLISQEFSNRFGSRKYQIKGFTYVDGLNHNLFSVGQFCDADLEVAFWKSTCFVRDLQGNDLLTGNRGTDLYTISLQETTSSTPICLMAKASPTQAWLWHRRLSHLNFDYINLLSKKDVMIGLPKLKYVKDQLCSSYEVSKAKQSSFKSKIVPSSKGRLNLLHMDLCGPMRVASINGKKYILVIVDDYSRYTWTLFLRSKDENTEAFKRIFIKCSQINLQALVISVALSEALRS
ncbi:retrovirus-related pol polyprotein from transposon TNT 1-94 [Tanacetum coccineum]